MPHFFNLAMASLFFSFLLDLYRDAFDYSLSTTYNKNLTPDYGVAILVISLPCLHFHLVPNHRRGPWTSIPKELVPPYRTKQLIWPFKRMDHLCLLASAIHHIQLQILESSPPLLSSPFLLTGCHSLRAACYFLAPGAYSKTAPVQHQPPYDPSEHPPHGKGYLSILPHGIYSSSYCPPHVSIPTLLESSCCRVPICNPLS